MGVSRYRTQVELALRAADVAPPAAYTWFGRRSRPLPGAESLVQALAVALYRSFYTQGMPVPISRHAAVPAPPDPEFVTALSRANVGRGGWQPGWRVERPGPAEWEVARDGLRIRVAPADRRGGPATVSVRRPKEHREASPGFYTALGDAEPNAGDAVYDVEVRVYFHLTAAGAVPLVGRCTHLLNAAGVPFELKVVDHPTGFVRADAGVLYLAEPDFARVRPALRELARACRPHLRQDVPAFTRQLAPGVAVGEHDPRLGASFGSTRCRLLAEAIVDAHGLGLEGRVDTVERRFEVAGLDLDRAYLARPAAGDAHVL